MRRLILALPLVLGGCAGDTSSPTLGKTSVGSFHVIASATKDCPSIDAAGSIDLSGAEGHCRHGDSDIWWKVEKLDAASIAAANNARTLELAGKLVDMVASMGAKAATGGIAGGGFDALTDPVLHPPAPLVIGQ